LNLRQGIASTRGKELLPLAARNCLKSQRGSSLLYQISASQALARLLRTFPKTKYIFTPKSDKNRARWATYLMNVIVQAKLVISIASVFDCYGSV
jgi:hypothetical protein